MSALLLCLIFTCEPAPRVLVIGDSITRGGHITRALERMGYESIGSQPTPGDPDLVSEGWSSRTAGDFVSNAGMSLHPTAPTYIGGLDPDVVVIALGSNDAVRDWVSTYGSVRWPAPLIASQMIGVILTARDLWPSACVVLTGYAQGSTNPADFASHAGGFIGWLARRSDLLDWIERYAAPLADGYVRLDVQGQTWDDVHPTPKGGWVAAGQIHGAIMRSCERAR